jgi:hypothetical protein
MNPDRIVEMIVEIPAGTRNKYEYDHKRHVIFQGRDDAELSREPRRPPSRVPGPGAPSYTRWRK